ncbi:hypothetical protein WH50_00115 [Pokkaliibacter plantistimulans]|uniref:Nudix hydrolase domain-containing protein n=1 Tax=Pokkaliibacter plantistimulans TaxID=1635171 RepID=A0ABX5M451_9GAMM|nr:hypothetical protein WH50_00115 [Pokkaliibacter plantistimulans]
MSRFRHCNTHLKLAIVIPRDKLAIIIFNPKTTFLLLSKRMISTNNGFGTEGGSLDRAKALPPFRHKVLL